MLLNTGTANIPFFTPRDAPDAFYAQDTDKHVTELGLSKCASELIPRTRSLSRLAEQSGKVAMPSVPMAMNQSCYALRGRSGVWAAFPFYDASGQVVYLKN